MGKTLKPPPRSLKELKKEGHDRGLANLETLDKASRDKLIKEKRSQLLLNIWDAHGMGRSIEKASILLVGSSGVGKSSTINHLFGLSEEESITFAKTSDSKSETRTTTEYVIEVDSPVRFEASGLKLGLVDTPGFNDTDGTRQDACNFYSIREFYDKHMKGCKPNLVLILIQATDTRIQGENSNLAKSLRCLKSLELIDTKYPNVVAVLTWSTALGEKKAKYTKNITRKKEIVKETVFEFLNVHAPVVALENEIEDLEEDGEFTILPDGTRQVKNLYSACEQVMKKSGDLYGHLIFNEAFNLGKKKVSRGKRIQAKNAKVSKLSKEENEFSEFFTQALAGGTPDPLVHEAKEFIEKENLKDNKNITEIQSLVGSLKKMGVNDLNDLNYISSKGMKLKHHDEISGNGEKFLNSMGVKDTTYHVGQDSAAVIAQGYNILNDSIVPSQIFSYKESDTKYGIAIPSLAQLKPVNETQTFMFSYDTKEKLIQDRLAHLNISLNVDVSKFNFSAKAGFNLNSSTSTDAHSYSKELSFYLEERMFELSMGNFMSNDIVLTEDFKNAVKNLPKVFNVEDAGVRSKFEQFFDRWGHFVVTKAIGGGSVELRVNTSSFSSQLKDVNSIKGSLIASFNSGFFNTDASVDGSDGNSKTVTSKQIFDSSTVKWSGGAREFHKKRTIGDEHMMDTWRNSLITSPTMLTTDMYLEPISTLIQLVDETKCDAAYESLKDFLGGKFDVVAKRQADAKEAERKRKEAEAEAERKRKEEEANTRAKTTQSTPSNNGKGGGCIHLDSTTKVLRDGAEITLQLKELVVGDEVLGYDIKKKTPVYTKLIMWAHTDKITPTKFLHLELKDGSGIKLTMEHLIMVGESYCTKMAQYVEEGDLLFKKNVGFLKVLKISEVVETGFCCPITESGNIMVNGILTSCYANLSDICIFGKTLISAQTVGRIVSAPFMAYRKISKDNGKAMVSDTHYHPYVMFLRTVFRPLISY